MYHIQLSNYRLLTNEALLAEATSKSNQDEVFWMVGAKNKDGKIVANSKLMKLSIDKR